MEYNINKFQEALVFEQEKNMTLERELNDIHRKIRMLNKGSVTLDKIVRMGRTEKTTIGLGYQGGTSSSQTVFVRGNSVEPEETRVLLANAKDQDKELSTVSKCVLVLARKVSLMIMIIQIEGVRRDSLLLVIKTMETCSGTRLSTSSGKIMTFLNKKVIHVSCRLNLIVEIMVRYQWFVCV